MFCGKCGHELPSESKFCPQCGTSPAGAQPVAQTTPGRWYYSIPLIIFSLLFLPPLGVILMWAGGRFSQGVRIAVSAIATLWFLVILIPDQDRLTDGEPNTAAADTTISPSTTNVQQPGSTSQRFQIGEAFRLGDFAYQIDSVRQERVIGNEFISEQAGSDATFLLVFYAIRNDSNESRTVLSSDFKLIDGNGRSFSPDSNAEVAYSMSGGGNDLILSELHPGITERSARVFRIPLESLESKLILEVPEKGLMSTGKIYVELD